MMHAFPPFCLLFWLVCQSGIANAADKDYCTLYSREMVRGYLRSLSATDLPNITIDGLQYQLTRYWTICLNRDEEPIIKDLPSDGSWTASLWTDIQRTLPHPAGSVLATDAPDAPVPVKPLPATQSPRSPTRSAAVPRQTATTLADNAPQPLCSSHGMKTVYSGRSWRCLTK